MRKVFLTTILFFGLSVATAVLAQPGVPNQFYGTVSFANDQLAPDGTMVQIKDETDGKTVAECPVKGGKGKYGYNPILCFVTDPESNLDGDTLHFFINGIDTNETATFHNGASMEKDFTLASVNAGEINNEVNSPTTMIVVPDEPATIKIGNNLNISITSASSTNAVVEEVKKLADSDFSGAMTVLSGEKLLGGYQIKIKKGGEADINISVTMKYDDTGINEDDIMPYYFDGNSWVKISSYSQSKSANTITFSIPVAHTPYALFGVPANASNSSNNGGGGGNSGGGGGVSTNNNNKDTVAPSISSVNIQAGRDNTIITWKTNEPSISWITYGTTTAYGKELKKTDYSTDHSIKIENLLPGATYHFQIKSKDSSGNVGQYTDKSFTTKNAQIKGDINNDNKVNKYDFALMMSEWGKTGLNIASDLNNDGKVDKYDFSLLMINWAE